MSLIRAALGQVFAGASMDISNPNYWMSDVAQSRRTLAGAQVSPATSMTLSTYYACLRSIAEDVGKITLHLYEGQDAEGGRKKTMATESPLYRLLRWQPCPESTSQTFRETLTGNALGWGNGYAEIQRTASGKPIALWPIHPSRVRMQRVDGQVVYDVMSSEWQAGATVRLASKDVLHIHGVGEDGVSGLSIARLAAESIGLGLSMQDFGASYFGNGSHTSMIIMHPGKYSEVAEKTLRESWQKMYSGPENAHKTAVLWDGSKVERTSIPPNEAQFLEGRQFQVEEICRWFRMPPHKVQHLLRATFSNIEHLDIEYVRDTLMPWLVRWESEISRKLIPEADQTRYAARHDVSELMRGDSAARSNYLRSMISTGAMTINEARELEGFNPVDDDIGEALFMQGAMTTVERIVEGQAPVNASARPGKMTATPRFPEDEEPEDGEEEDEDETEMDASVFLPVFSDAEARVCRKESMAVANVLRKNQKAGPSLTEWAGQFYAEHQGYIVDAFAPAVKAVEHARQMSEPGWQAPTGFLASVAKDFCMKRIAHVVRCEVPPMQSGELADAVMGPLLANVKPRKVPAVASLQPLVMNIHVDDSNASKALSVERDANGRMTGVKATSTKTKAIAIARDKDGQIVGMQ